MIGRRILVAGTSGSGKSTLCRKLSELLDLPYTELDSLYHGPNWVRRSSFETDVRALAAAQEWITEWQYGNARPILLERADSLVLLDYGRLTIGHRVLRRSIRRAALHEPIFNGNTEGFRAWLDPGHPVRWSWSSYGQAPQQALAAQAVRPDLLFVRLGSPRAARRWLGRLAAHSDAVRRSRPD